MRHGYGQDEEALQFVPSHVELPRAGQARQGTPGHAFNAVVAQVKLEECVQSPERAGFNLRQSVVAQIEQSEREKDLEDRIENI